MGQLIAIGRTMWGPKVPTLKGTKVSLSCVQCFLYLVSSSINVCIFHVTIHGWILYGHVLSYLSCSVATCGSWLPYWTVQIQSISITESFFRQHWSTAYIVKLSLDPWKPESAHVLQPFKAGHFPWDLGKQKKMCGAVGMLDMPLSRVGEPCTLEATCPQARSP